MPKALPNPPNPMIASIMIKKNLQSLPDHIQDANKMKSNKSNKKALSLKIPPIPSDIRVTSFLHRFYLTLAF